MVQARSSLWNVSSHLIYQLQKSLRFHEAVISFEISFHQNIHIKEGLSSDNYLTVFFCISIFFSHDIQDSQDSRGRRTPILTPLRHFHSLHNLLDISRDYCKKITFAHSWWLDLNQEPLVYHRKSLTTKLRDKHSGIKFSFSLEVNSSPKIFPTTYWNV